MRQKEGIVEDLTGCADLILIDEVCPHDMESVEVHVRLVFHGPGPEGLMREVREWIKRDAVSS